MSGGVDSSAAAWLLKEQGHEVIGLFMRSGVTEETACATGDGQLPILHQPTTPTRKQGCCSSVDAADARRVADALDIPFHALNMQSEFGRIMDYFADEYFAGRTPNPCAMCNIWLKFGRLWEFAEQVQADHIATGHYARLLPVEGDTEPGLCRGVDDGKDQSYVLFGIRRELLSRILFPVGTFQKDEIREMASHAGLSTATKPDSQEICFVPDNDYVGFLDRYRGAQDTEGEFVDTAGNVLGQHPGIEHFTVGQRKGLGITFGSPRFVVRIEPESRRVVLGTKDDLARRTLEADRLNWLAPCPTGVLRCEAQIRYQHAPAACTARVIDDDRLQVEFDEPQFGVAPGQAVVLYDGDRVLGGGWIA